MGQQTLEAVQRRCTQRAPNSERLTLERPGAQAGQGRPEVLKRSIRPAAAAHSILSQPGHPPPPGRSLWRSSQAGGRRWRKAHTQRWTPSDPNSPTPHTSQPNPTIDRIAPRRARSASTRPRRSRGSSQRSAKRALEVGGCRRGGRVGYAGRSGMGGVRRDFSVHATITRILKPPGARPRTAPPAQAPSGAAAPLAPPAPLQAKAPTISTAGLPRD